MLKQWINLQLQYINFIVTYYTKYRFSYYLNCLNKSVISEVLKLFFTVDHIPNFSIFVRVKFVFNHTFISL